MSVDTTRVTAQAAAAEAVDATKQSEQPDGTKASAAVDETKKSEHPEATTASAALAAAELSAVPLAETKAPATPEPQAAAAAPPAAAAAKSADTGSRRPPWMAIGIVVGVIAIVGIVIAVASSGSSKHHATAAAAGGSSGPAQPASQTATAGPLTVSYTRPWKPTTSAPAGASALQGTPIQLSNGHLGLAAGLLKTSSPVPGGVPPALLKQYRRPVESTDTTVARGNGRAYTWNSGSTRVVAYVLPAASGDAAIICSSPDGTATDQCASLASSAKASNDLQLLPPGPATNFGSQLAAPLKPVASMRDGLHGLSGSTLASRVGPARRLASAEAKAARTIRALGVPGRCSADVGRLVTALQHESSAFSGLAGAAQANNRGSYAAHARSVEQASKTLSAASLTLAAAQLGLPKLGTLSLAGPPAPPAPAASTSSSSSSSGATSSGSSSSSSAPRPARLQAGRLHDPLPSRSRSPSSEAARAEPRALGVYP